MLPCFASHTFREEIQQELGIPVLDLMAALAEHIRRIAEPGTQLGILASDYVRHSGLFERYLGGDFQLVYPPEPEQRALMDAMYGLLALYATCKRLESAGAQAIAIGLLATSGTVQSQVYHQVARHAGLPLLIPGFDYQELVMNAIYGERGIKAGLTEGLCKEQLLLAVEHLCELGAEVIILGCTQLPLVLSHCEDFQVHGHRVALVDPTTVLALRCVSLAASDGGWRHGTSVPD